MLGREQCDDVGYEHLLRAIAEREDPDAPQSSRPIIAQMIQVGMSGVAYDLAFPEVFHPRGDPTRSGGFDAVLGNPPWEKLRIEQRELAATLDPAFLEGRERAGVGDEAEAISAVVAADPAAVAVSTAVTQSRRVALRVLRPSLADVLPGKTLDTYQLFAARCVDWAGPSAGIGLVLGGGFAKSPTEEPLREVLAKQSHTELLAHYVNIRQLFGGTSSRVSFALWAARMGSALFEPLIGNSLEAFTDIGVPGVPGGRLVPLRVEEPGVATLSSTHALEFMGLFVTEGLHRRHNKAFFSFTDPQIPDARDPAAVVSLAQRGHLCLYGGKSIDAFDVWPRKKSGKWDPRVTLLVSLKSPRVVASRDVHMHFRLAWRNTCGLTATNERSARACVLPPLVAAVGSIMVETAPQKRPQLGRTFGVRRNQRVRVRRAGTQGRSNQLQQIDPLARQHGPRLTQEQVHSLFHSALRLSSIHEGYAPLWSEQLGIEWCEPSLEAHLACPGG